MSYIGWDRTGCTREVVLIGAWAIKVPKLTAGWRLFLYGLLANMQERTFARAGWCELCPVLWSLPGGWLVVMRRARPLSREEWDGFDADSFIAGEDRTIPVEAKMSSFGWLDGRVVALDYGS